MKRPLVFDWEARDELEDARRWYKNRSSHVAERFVAAARSAMTLIEEHPERWAEFRPGVRRVLLRKFPFVIVYAIEPERVVALAVMHTSRDPGYWQDRKGDKQPR